LSLHPIVIPMIPAEFLTPLIDRPLKPP